MTGPAVIGAYVSATLGCITLLGILWRKVLKPLGLAAARVLTLVDEATVILRDWPTYQTIVAGQGAELTALGVLAGEIRLQNEKLARDVDQLWRRTRGDVEPAPASPPARRRRSSASEQAP